MELSLPVLLTLLLAGVSPWWLSRHRGSFMVLGGLLHLGHALHYGKLLVGAVGGARVVETGPQMFPTELVEWSFVGTAWGLMFAVLITGIGLLVFLYAVGYFGNSAKGVRFFLPLLVFEAAMLGLVLADHAILLCLFWELTSISSFFLIGFSHKEATSRWNAQQALLVTGCGGMCLLAAFLMLGADTGTLSIDRWREMAVAGMSPSLPVLVLMLLAAATKSALFPFSFWLPNAMSAPTPVSSYLHSATMVKAGIFLIGSLFPLFASSPEIMRTLVILGGVTALVGLVLGWIQTDLKKILAYTTLSALGLLAFFLGMGTMDSIKVAVLYLLAHACYKAGLFMAAGAIEKVSGSRDLRELGGMWKSFPGLGVAAAGLACSAIGLPPLIGFVAKEYAYNLGLPDTRVVWGLTGFLFVANLAMMVLILRVAWTPFHGKAPERETKAADGTPPWQMTAGPMALIVAGLALGLCAPWLLSPLVNAVVGQMVGQPYSYELKLWDGFKPALFLSVATLVGGWLLFRATRPTGSANPLTTALGLPERAYTLSLNGLVNGAAWITANLQHGDLRGYLRLFFAGVMILVSFKWWQSGSDIFRLIDAMPRIPVLEGLLVPAMGTAIGLVVLTKSRISAVLGLAVVGLGMAFLFARLGAPDVALTLMLVESLTVVLFIYIVYGLPRIRNITPPRGRLLDATIALSVGLVMALLALKSQSVQLHPTISTSLTEWAYPLAKGKNVVNVILVDFRALDTLGEITVITLSAVGVYLLWTRRPDEAAAGERREEERP